VALARLIRRRFSWAGYPRRWWFSRARFRAAIDLLNAADRMRSRWADASPDVRNEMWRALHTAADQLGEAIQ
jgi:hypothetical protein